MMFLPFVAAVLVGDGGGACAVARWFFFLFFCCISIALLIVNGVREQLHRTYVIGAAQKTTINLYIFSGIV